MSKEWVHPNHTSKGGPGDPLLESKPSGGGLPLAYFASMPIYEMGPLRIGELEVMAYVPKCCPVCMSVELEGPHVRPNRSMLWECLRPGCGQHFVVSSKFSTPTLRKIAEELNAGDDTDE